MSETLVWTSLGVAGTIGLLLYEGRRSGWQRRGYFTVGTIILVVLAIFISFQGVGAVFVGMFAVLGWSADSSMLVANSLAQLVVMLGGTVFLSQQLGQDPFAVFRLEGFYETHLGIYALAIPIILSAQVVGESLSSLWEQSLSFLPFYSALEHFETSADSVMAGLITASNLGSFVVVLLAVAIVPAFAEETLFRGFMQTNIERSGRSGPRPIIAIVVTSLAFAAYHMSVFKFPGLLTIGAVLGWMAYRTNNLLVGSFGHALNNGIIVTMLYLAPTALGDSSKAELLSVDRGSMEQTAIALLTWTPLLVLSLIWFSRMTAGLQARHRAQAEFEEWEWMERDSHGEDDPY